MILTKHDDDPVYYEKAAVEKWIDKHRKPFSLMNWFKGVKEKKPPKWPDSLSLNKKALVPAEAVQNKIEKRLLILFTDFKKNITHVSIRVKG